MGQGGKLRRGAKGESGGGKEEEIEKPYEKWGTSCEVIYRGLAGGGV